jgi:hypothetical protein
MFWIMLRYLGDGLISIDQLLSIYISPLAAFVIVDDAEEPPSVYTDRFLIYSRQKFMCR